MPLEGHWERQHAPLRPGTRRERRVLIAVVAALAVAVVVVVVVAVSGSSAGCVTVTTATSTGGATVTRCGRDARDWCRSQAGARDAFGRQVEAACRRAGYR